MRGNPPIPSLVKLSDLPTGREHHFDFAPDTATCTALAEELGIRTLRKLRFTGDLRAIGRTDWQLRGTLGATVVQDCIITLDPVTTRIDEKVERRFMAQLPEIAQGGEEEMPEDDTIEPIPEILDLAALTTEALSLALPAYPRAKGAKIGAQTFTEPGKSAMTDEDTKPFAALADLKAKLQRDQ